MTTRKHVPKPKKGWWRPARLLVLLIVAAVVVLLGADAFGYGHKLWIAHRPGQQSAQQHSNGWTVGELRPNGLRIIPSGRSDASAVLSPEQFTNPAVRHAYWVATQIPAKLNQLYCWCGCENRGVHRSNLQCFEDRMAENCDVCRGTAEIAYKMTQQGITNAAQIQAAVDAQWAPHGAR